MSFKWVALVTCCIILAACKKAGYKGWEDTALYHTLVIINGKNTGHGIIVSSHKDSLISFAMERVTSDGIYWIIIFSDFSKKTQDIVLHKYPGQPPYGKYYSFCCIPEPDQPEYTYCIWEADSLNNVLHVDVDTGSRHLAGNFRATFVNSGPPYDTVRMRCDTFMCYWK